ncbi:hypothetical protein EYF80_016820 [Liparis tanakae]|uniref:Uncharacterized protein n=1 Tax=Liparis tanakae TaxID=230148 RepID=A0A4Z2I542_9TELE|nr:hypothetical protein EYF80_016820 [Liparis tanakae]
MYVNAGPTESSSPDLLTFGSLCLQEVGVSGQEAEREAEREAVASSTALGNSSNSHGGEERIPFQVRGPGSEVVTHSERGRRCYVEEEQD